LATEAPENDPALTCPYGRRSIMVAAALWSPQHLLARMTGGWTIKPVWREHLSGEPVWLAFDIPLSLEATRSLRSLQTDWPVFRCGSDVRLAATGMANHRPPLASFQGSSHLFCRLIVCCSRGARFTRKAEPAKMFSIGIRFVRRTRHNRTTTGPPKPNRLGPIRADGSSLA